MGSQDVSPRHNDVSVASTVSLEDDTERVDAVYLAISTCLDHESYEMRPLILLDDTTVAQLDTFEPFVAQPGTTYALKIPDELFETARTIRGAVVRRAPGSGVWTTHPLFTAADQPPN